MRSVYAESEKLPITSVFDLKGSMLGRRKGASDDVGKDLDFLDQGTKIYLGENREGFIQQLESDVAFLMSHNLMDYSLLVGIHEESKRDFRKSINPATGNFRTMLAQDRNGLSAIAKEAVQFRQKFIFTLPRKKRPQKADYFVFNDIDIESFQLSDTFEEANPMAAYNRLGNMRSLYPNGRFGDRYYYFGLIDFFQVYTVQKKIEANVHGLEGFLRRQKLEASAVSPVEYGRRLINFVKDHFVNEFPEA